MEQKKKFEFKKLNENRYAFIMQSEDILRTEEVDKDYVKVHYGELQKQKQEVLNQLAQANKQLELNNIEYNAELEKFINMANDAAKYHKYQQAKQNQESLLKMNDDINMSISHIENVIPEVKRMKK